MPGHFRMSMASIGLASAFPLGSAGCCRRCSYGPGRTDDTARLARRAVWHDSVVLPVGCAQVRPGRRVRLGTDGGWVGSRTAAGARPVFARVADRARIVAARDRDPRTPAEALEGSPRRARPRWRRRGDAAGRSGRSGRDARPPPAPPPRRPPHRPVRPRRPQGRGRAGPCPASQARPAVRGGRQVAAEDPVLGDGRAEPDADLAVHVRALGDRAAGGRHRPARRRRRDLQHVPVLPRRRRRGRRRAARSPTARC